jgi:opacity protein-like surface antigen
MWCVILTFSILSLFSDIYAQDFSRKFVFGLGGSWWKSGLTEHSDIYTVGRSGTFSFRYNLKDKIALGLSASYAKAWEADLSESDSGGAGFTFSRKDNGNIYTHTWLDLSLIRSFRPWEKINPYLFGGLGLAWWNVKDANGDYVQFPDLSYTPFDLKDQELTFSLGAGVEYRFKERYGINLGTRCRILSRILTDFKGNKDVVGGAPDELDLPKGTLEFFLGINYYVGKLLDSDRDGVPDKVDFCSDTPFGAIVDDRGCPLDSDGDGIYDGLDRCPATPPGTSVDVNGCPR